MSQLVLGELSVMIKISEHTLVEQYNKYASYESKRWQDLAAQNVNSWADVWEQSVAHLSHRPIVHEVGFISPWSYQELDRAADKIAEWAISSNQKYIGVHQNNSAVFLAKQVHKINYLFLT
ncbi:MAG: hypothetical protein F6K50_39030 [Moorea sp. SIO3I7]|uniref:hypothetical protein n=1 Tax=Moorena sp. SIO3I8 TaxID=2607833 RepID=UPI0013BEC488|nr:hypothetical protein [Moorena sp. SIO3I8]NEO01196.1 hypothetical protein [Moorena sp. SIO3I7]NEO10319.1 hypothetical protein [Moorena sp. SIO3I8]